MTNLQKINSNLQRMGSMKLLSQRNLTTLLPAVLVAGFFFGCSKPSDRLKDAPTVAITQIIEHKSLDREREGILAGLKEAGYEDGKNINIVFESAQGNISTAAQIATKFQSLNPDVAIAISTPSAQALVNALKNTNIPIVFSAVTDPLHAKLVENMDKRESAVTGVSDAISAKSQLDLIRTLIPHIKKIGIIFNPGEQNSVKSVNDMKDASKNYGIEVFEGTASKTSDVAAAAQSLVGKVDAFYIPNDNTAVSAIQSIIQVGEKSKIPVFAGDEGSFKDGVVAVAAYDRFTLGKRVADYVIKILNGAFPGDLPVLRDHPTKKALNLKAAHAVGLQVDTSHLKDFDIQD